jgi:hypothetical protein
MHERLQQSRVDGTVVASYAGKHEFTDTHYARC